MKTGKHKNSHQVTPRPSAFRKDAFNQDSRLLTLPAEIRNHIYEFALTKHDRQIDLWPYAKIETPIAEVSCDATLRQRAQALIERHDARREGDRTVHLYMRDQQDLKYVRTRLSVALLSTCRQVYDEAFQYFYRYNRVRFSDDISFIGVRRFLTTIGLRARQEIKTLQLAYPDAFVSYSGQYVHQEAEHYPSLEALAPLYLDQIFATWDNEWEDNPEIPACNAAFVAHFLRTEMRDTLQELQFVITNGNWFRARSESRWLDPNVKSAVVRPVLLHEISPQFMDTPWLRKVIIVESGAMIYSADLCQGAVFKDCTLLMLAGSKNSAESEELPERKQNDEPWLAKTVFNVESLENEPCWEWTQDQWFLPSNPSAEEDLSFGILELFETYEVSVAACGGRVRASPSVARPWKLKKRRGRSC